MLGEIETMTGGWSCVWVRVACLVLVISGGSDALIVGRDAETKAAGLEKEKKYKEAAVWRLVAARGFKELIIPFENESVVAYTEAGEEGLAKICANRAKVLYPRKVKVNARLYGEDLRKAGGESVRKEVEDEAARILAKYAPIPLSVPSRLSRVEKKEEQGDWLTAARYRELSGRIFVGITVPFFEREEKRTEAKAIRERSRSERLKYLRLAVENFGKAGEHYVRAAALYPGKKDAESVRLLDSCEKKSLEMKRRGASASALISPEAGPSEKTGE